MKIIIKSFLLLITALFAPPFAFGQTGGITGVVSDVRVGPLLYAQVSVSTGNGQKHLVLTDYDGRFLVKPLPPGNYNVTVTFKGQRDIIRQVAVPQSGLVTIDISFPRGDTEEAIHETAGREISAVAVQAKYTRLIGR